MVEERNFVEALASFERPQIMTRGALQHARILSNILRSARPESRNPKPETRSPQAEAQALNPHSSTRVSYNYNGNL